LLGPRIAPLALLLGCTLVLGGCGGAEPKNGTTQNATLQNATPSAELRSDTGGNTGLHADIDADLGTSDAPAPVISTIAANEIEPSASAATVLVLGDSISAAYGIQREMGWVSLLQQYVRSIDEDFTVINASISGETTAGGLARFAQSLAEHQPKITVIELGGNDGLRGYPLQQVKSNLTKLVQMAKAANSQVLLLGMQIPPNYGARYSSGFAKLFDDIASSEQVRLVPSFLERIALTPGMLQADGIHPVQAAQPKLLETVQPELDKLIKSLVR
jgi:acyl-CoA thioesterase-1